VVIVSVTTAIKPRNLLSKQFEKVTLIISKCNEIILLPVTHGYAII
jgi:hypothetical protein